MTLRADFQQFHKDNPHIWRAFERFALEAAATGRKHFGVAAIWERLRWHSQMETRDKAGWKLNNSFRAFYCRLWKEKHPEYPDFFQTRRSVADRKAAPAGKLF